MDIEGYTLDDLDKAIKKEPTKIYYSFKDYEYNDKGKERVTSGLKQLDYLLSGFELGCITMWTGVTNSGKTTMLTKLTKETIEQGEKVFYFNGEQTKDDFKNNIYKQSVPKEAIVKKRYKDTNIYDYYINDYYLQTMKTRYDDNLFIYNNEVKRDIGTLLYAMEEVRQKYGVRVFVLDNLMQIDITSDNIYQEQSNIMEKLRTFAVNKQVHIHLVAHPRKVADFQVRLTLYDVAGSMNLANKAYNIISIIRTSNIVKDSQEYRLLQSDLLNENYVLDDSDGILEVLKTKGNRCGLVGMKYDPLTKTYQMLPQISPEVAESLKVNKPSFKGGKNKCPF